MELVRAMENSSPIVSFGHRFGAIVLVISGSISGYFLFQKCLSARATGAWPSVSGLITKAEVGTRGVSSYYADVSYSYEVGGREFTGHRIDRSNFGYSARDGAEQAIQGLAPGQWVAVHFDPSDPAQSVLRPGAGAQDYLLLLVPILSLFIGLAGIRSLLRGGAQRSRMGANTPIEHDSHDRTGTKAAKVGGRPLPVHKAIIRAWGDLLASRQSLLLRAYSETIRARDPDDFDPATVAEARQRFDAIHQSTFPSDSARAAQEFRIVLAVRLTAAWLVSWTTIVPAGIVGWLLLLRIRHRIGFPDVQSFVQFLIGLIFLLLIFGVMGLFIQAILCRPFIAVLNRLVASANNTDRAPIADEPKDPTGGNPG
jgi:Protein of unknown function (DUF3592)